MTNNIKTLDHIETQSNKEYLSLKRNIFSTVIFNF
jgi:hypothetical protein